jgi:uncharacterized protein (TIGR02246 family)
MTHDDCRRNRRSETMKRLFVVLLMLAVSRPLVAQKPQDSVLPTRSPTYPTPSPQQGDAGITQLLKDYEAAFNKADVKALTALYTDDAIQLGDDNRVISGRAAIEQFNRESLADKPPTLTVRPGRTRLITGDVGVTEGTYELADGERGIYVITAVRHDGQWKLASVVAVPNTPR